jgi:hypothetical protein
MKDKIVCNSWMLHDENPFNVSFNVSFNVIHVINVINVI